jgi:hypothetical protein
MMDRKRGWKTSRKRKASSTRRGLKVLKINYINDIFLKLSHEPMGDCGKV